MCLPSRLQAVALVRKLPKLLRVLAQPADLIEQKSAGSVAAIDAVLTARSETVVFPAEDFESFADEATVAVAVGARCASPAIALQLVD